MQGLSRSPAFFVSPSAPTDVLPYPTSAAFLHHLQSATDRHVIGFVINCKGTRNKEALVLSSAKPFLLLPQPLYPFPPSATPDSRVPLTFFWFVFCLPGAVGVADSYTYLACNRNRTDPLCAGPALLPPLMWPGMTEIKEVIWSQYTGQLSDESKMLEANAQSMGTYSSAYNFLWGKKPL